MTAKNYSSGNAADQKQIHGHDTLPIRQVIRLFLGIAIYRLANAWLIRTQFDPDEYWQNLEPAYCLVFGSADVDDIATSRVHGKDQNVRQIQHRGCALTWEWTRRWTPPPSASTNRTLQSTATAQSNEAMLQILRPMMDRALYGPVRSYVSILPTYWYYLACRSLFSWAQDVRGVGDVDHNGAINESDARRYYHYTNFQNYLKHSIRQHATYLVSKGPAFIHALLVAAPTDLCVWLIASRMNNLQPPITSRKPQHTGYFDWSSWPFWALTCSITSWFNGYALVRTYANAVETVCLLAGIALLGPELFGQSHSELGSNPRRCCHRPQAKLAFVLGGLGACVRFTSLAAWVPVGLIVALHSRRSNSRDDTKKSNHQNMLHTLVGLCAVYGLLGVILGCCIDRWFYGFWAIPFLGNIHFNVLLGHGSLYGTHPFLWYTYAGIPAICGIMLPFFLWEITPTNKVVSNGFWKSLKNPSLLIQQDNPKESECNNPQAVLLGIIASYVILHSFSEHKEFRFMLPILPLICISAGHAIAQLANAIEEAANGGDDGLNYGRNHSSPLKSSRRDKWVWTSPKFLLAAVILLNYPHLFYLGIVHQRGPIAVNKFLTSAIDKDALQNSQIEKPQQHSIHYLMGCHSAPLFSHLHTHSAQVSAWYLDCSPDCRSNPEMVCESDVFSSDPLGFVRSVYGISNDDGCSEEGIIEGPPSFVVVMQDDAMAIDSVLSDNLELIHIASIRHTVKSLSWHHQTHYHGSNGECLSHERCHDCVTLFSLIDVHFNHMDVFKTSRHLLTSDRHT